MSEIGPNEPPRSEPRLVVHSAPFLRQGVTTPGLMGDVLLALLPVLGFAVWNFGLPALAVVAAATAGAVGTEGLASRRSRRSTLSDRSALLTGVLLGLTLPPGLPLWMAFLGGVTAIGLGKLIWGGLGDNLFNPALVGRAFLQAAFPIALTTWVPPASRWSLVPGQLAWPLMSPDTADAITTATPLNQMKFAGTATPVGDLFLGGVSGSAGETSALILLLAGAYLVARRAFDWRIPASILLTVAAFSGVLHLVAPERFASPLFMLLSGGLLLGAVFMATDPVTSPLAPRGAWLFGFGVGLLVVLIRIWGGLPEGVMYAILLMNAATPLIERFTQPRAFGHGRKEPA
jgi:electron transport complex protein RnfD